MKINYRCSLCGFECSSTKRRVKCLDCGKMALVEQESAPEKPKRKLNEKQAQFTENKFIDDGTKFTEDKKFTKVISKIGTVSPRTRKNHIRMKNCSRCNAEFKCYANEYLCNNCGMGK